LIYVDSDAALCAGREIWGFPKKLAHIEVEQEADQVRACLVRGGTELLSLTGSIEERVDPTAVAALGALPIYNQKLIPGSAAKEPDVDRLTQVYLDMVIHEASSGTGTLRAADEVAAVVGGPMTIPMLATVVDSVLPAGEDLS
jgi:acetoacetate decarboxylase